MLCFQIDKEISEVNLPKTVMRWLGLSQPNGKLTVCDQSLVLLNDAGISFDEIADLIKEDTGLQCI